MGKARGVSVKSHKKIQILLFRKLYFCIKFGIWNLKIH